MSESLGNRQESSDRAPVFGSDAGGWFFRCLDDTLAGPYSTRDRGVAKYEEYCDWINAPACHHPREVGGGWVPIKDF